MKGWRTITFNALALAVPVLELTEWRDVLPQDWLPYYMLAVSVGNLWLRMLTTTPVGRRQ